MFDFDVAHHTGIKIQAVDALLRLHTTGQNTSTLENNPSLYTINDVNGRHTAIHTVAHNEHHSREVPNAKYDPLTNV